MWVLWVMMMRMRSLMSQDFLIRLFARKHLLKLLVEVVVMVLMVVM
jgi:hypothetical protein